MNFVYSRRISITVYDGAQLLGQLIERQQGHHLKFLIKTEYILSGIPYGENDSILLLIKTIGG
jgi:hypothetical protein